MNVFDTVCYILTTHNKNSQQADINYLLMSFDDYVRNNNYFSKLGLRFKPVCDEYKFRFSELNFLYHIIILQSLK